MSKTITLFSLIIIPIALLIEIFFWSTASYLYFACLEAPFIIRIFLLFFIYCVQPGMTFNQTAKFHRECVVNFENDIILFQTKGVKSEYTWDMYDQLWESDKYFYLIQARDIYTLLPKRVFTGKEQEREFVNLYLQHHSKDTYKVF